MKRPAKKFALGTLAVSVIWIFFEHIMGFNSTRHDIGQYTRMFPMIFFWVMIIVAIYYKRRGHGDTLTFGEGFKTGLVMTLIFCAGFTFIIFLYQQFLNPEYYSSLKDFTMQSLQERHASPETTDAEMKEVDITASGSPLSYLLLFVFSAIWGIVISAVATLFLMRKPKTI